MQRSALWRSRRELSNEYFLAKFRFDGWMDGWKSPSHSQHVAMSLPTCRLGIAARTVSITSTPPRRQGESVAYIGLERATKCTIGIYKNKKISIKGSCQSALSSAPCRWRPAITGGTIQTSSCHPPKIEISLLMAHAATKILSARVSIR